MTFQIIKKVTRITQINYKFYPYIGKLQFKNGLFNYLKETDLKQKYKPHNLSKEKMFEFISAYKKLSLIHYVRCYPKLWEKTSLRKITQKPCVDTKIYIIMKIKPTIIKKYMIRI